MTLLGLRNKKGSELLMKEPKLVEHIAFRGRASDC